MNKDIFFNRVAILGVGLIGASFALAMRARKLCGHISGFGRMEANLAKAKKKGIIDSFDLDPVRACADADLILFSLPVGFAAGMANGIKDSVKEGALVTDAGSVKGELVHRMEEIFSGRGSFVGAHPIAGSEKSGVDTADPELFYGRRCIVTATEKTDKSALELLINLWQCLGAKVVMMSPEEHDRVFGAISHLPHIIAYEMVNTVGEINGSYIGYAGQGFMDSTRIASSSPELWRDICILNRRNLLGFIDAFIERLEKVKRDIGNEDAESLEQEFRKAKALRDGIGQD